MRTIEKAVDELWKQEIENSRKEGGVSTDRKELCRKIVTEYTLELLDEIMQKEIQYTLSSGAVISAVRSLYINDLKYKINE